VRTVTGAGTLAFLHTVRYPNGAPAGGGLQFVANSDDHEYLVQHVNLIVVLSVVAARSAGIDATSGDAAVVRALVARAGAYDRAPSRAPRVLDPHSDQWQIWPSWTDLPAPPGLPWGKGEVGLGGSDVGDIAPGAAGALGPLACTNATVQQIAAGDPTIIAHRGNGYSENPPTGAGPNARSTMALDLLYFVSPATATTGYDRLAADMATCGPRLRQAQAQAGVSPPDASAGPAARGPGYGVWRLTGTGLYPPVPIWVMRNLPGVPPFVELLVVIVVRGPLVEVASVAVDAADVGRFGTGTAFATAMATALCRYDIGCR
jgi:hypothetical protein